MKNQREKIVAGNWKMNMTFEEGRALISQIRDGMGPSEHKVVICPPYFLLKSAAVLLKDIHNMAVGAQNCHHEDSGAYTGEISAEMIRSTNCKYVIIGHSERREYFNESDEILARKTAKALQAELKPIFCCGEKSNIRDAGKQNEIVKSQLENGLLKHLPESDFKKVAIAYEPVWAIGTGKTATPDQAQEMHTFIRALIADTYNDEIAQNTTLLYGGSCKPDNAKELFSQEDVDGGLIGGASLAARDFIAIIKALHCV